MDSVPYVAYGYKSSGVDHGPRRDLQRGENVNFHRRSGKLLRVLTVAVSTTALGTIPTRAALIDCKVILCLAGGFPSGCADAYSYMMDRITRLRPLPPFGTCHTVSLQGAQEVYDAAHGWLASSQGPKRCVALAPRTREDDGGWCIRQCWDLNHDVNLRVEIDGQAPYSARYTYARTEQCEGLGRDGRSSDDAR